MTLAWNSKLICGVSGWTFVNSVYYGTINDKGAKSPAEYFNRSIKSATSCESISVGVYEVSVHSDSERV